MLSTAVCAASRGLRVTALVDVKVSDRWLLPAMWPGVWGWRHWWMWRQVTSDYCLPCDQGFQGDGTVECEGKWPVTTACHVTRVLRVTALLNVKVSDRWLLPAMWPGPRFNIKMSSYQDRKSHCGDKTIFRPSDLHNGISYTGKMTSLYWIRAQGFEGDGAVECEGKWPVTTACHVTRGLRVTAVVNVKVSDRWLLPVMWPGVWGWRRCWMWR